MTRIDHMAEAARMRDMASHPLPVGLVQAYTSAATYHATAALVEQHKIANLISLARLAGNENIQEELNEAAYGALDMLLSYESVLNGHPEGPDEVVVLNPDIAAVLKIGDKK